MKTSRSTVKLGRSQFFPRCLLGLGLSALPLAALAWNATGHRLVAEIAWRQMSDAARAQTAGLLLAHPDLEKWRQRAKSDDARALFVEASTWPDEIRKDSRFYTPGKEDPTPALAGFPDMQRHSNWHTVPRRFDGGPLPADQSPGLLDKQLKHQLAVLDNPGAEGMRRSYALPWVIHLTGDGHQPLHLSLRRDAQGEWDRLGHGLTVSNPFNERKPKSTLHEYWDDLPIGKSLRGERLSAEADSLLARHAAPPPRVPPEQWLEESWHAARDLAYPPAGTSPVLIGEDFYQRSKDFAEQRIVAAGHRLAERLNRAFEPSP